MKAISWKGLVAVPLLGLGMAAQAALYTFDRAVGAGSVSGYFETDGTIGPLSPGNFIDWSITISSPDLNGGVPTTSAGATSTLFFSDGVSATATDILYDFDGNDSFFTFTPTGDFWCVAGSTGDCFVPNAEVIGYDDQVLAEAESAGYSGVQSIASLAVSEPGGLALVLLAGGLIGVGVRRRIA